jgi:hypothetical protein
MDVLVEKLLNELSGRREIALEKIPGQPLAELFGC